MLVQLNSLVILNDLYLGVLYCLANKHLKNWLDLKIEVKKIRILVCHLNRFVVSLWVWYINWRGRLINIVVRLKFIFVHHVVDITQLLYTKFIKNKITPRILALQIHHLSPLLILLHHLHASHLLLFPFL